MASAVSLLTLRTRVRFEADMVNSTRATDAQINTLINTHYAELYDRLVQSGPADYFLSSTTVASAINTLTYALPADFRSMLGLFINDSPTRRREVPMVQEGTRAVFDAPQSVVNLTLEYVPTPVVLVNDSDTIDSVSGWDELVVQLCARALLRRERRDTSAFEATIAECRARVMANAPKRNMNGPRFVNDVEAAGDYPLYGVDATIDGYRLSGGNLYLYTITPVIP